jgi:broad specificity phosphatase PhoE
MGITAFLSDLFQLAKKDRPLAEYIRNWLQSTIYPWPKVLGLARHAESHSNYETDLINEGVITGYSQKVKGQRDMEVEITSRGEWQADQSGLWLRAIIPAFDVYYSSPYKRTRQTGERLYPGVEFRLETRLREKDFGLVDQMTDAEVAARYPEFVALRRHVRKFYSRMPGGENYPDMILRAHSFLNTLKRDYCGKTVLIVAHSAIIACFRFLLEHWTEEDLLQKQKSQPIKNASITLYGERKVHGKSRLELIMPPYAPWEKMKQPN